MNTKAIRFGHFARRLRASGLEIWRSDKTETIYIQICTDCILRLSAHELGCADYGQRQQRHKGPEVIAKRDWTYFEVIAACLEAVRDYSSSMAYDWTDSSRSAASQSIRKFRKIIARERKKAEALSQ